MKMHINDFEIHDSIFNLSALSRAKALAEQENPNNINSNHKFNEGSDKFNIQTDQTEQEQKTMKNASHSKLIEEEGSFKLTMKSNFILNDFNHTDLGNNNIKLSKKPLG